MMRKMVWCLLLCMALVVPAQANYQKLVDESLMRSGIEASSTDSFWIDGDDAYIILRGVQDSLVKVSNLSGVQTQSVVLDVFDWAAFGETNPTAFYGGGIFGDTLVFSTTGTDSVLKCDLTAGTLSTYVSKATIMGLTGETAVQMLSPTVVNPASGEFIFYEGTSDSILVTSSGAVSTLVSSAQLAAVAGDDYVSGGMEIVGTSLVYGNSHYDSLYAWDMVGGSGAKILDVGDILAVTNESAAGFGDILADDTMVYFYETTSDGIMSFDMADPAGTLTTVLSEAQLIAGPAGTDNVACLRLYGCDVAWNSFLNDSLFYIPEPMSMLLLGLGGVGLLRRRA